MDLCNGVEIAEDEGTIQMKTLVVGTGIIGVIYGWALSQAGVDVTHFVRKGRKEQFKNGVKLDVLDERKGHPKYNLTNYAIRCVEEISPADGYELIIVPTNMNQTESALKELVPVSGQAIFLTLSGNWDGTACIDKLLPRERYLMGYADGGGTIRDGAYWVNLGAEIHIGEVDGKPSEKLEKVKTLFMKADMKPDVQENIVHWLWQHAAGAVGFALGFAKHREIKTFLKDKELLQQCVLSTKEMYRLCALRGVDLKQFPEASFINLPNWLVTALVKWNIGHREAAQRYSAHGESSGSQQEMKAYYASMMKSADEVGFEMPYTKALIAYLN
jgi:2-dehydropantoate 2-reductase